MANPITFKPLPVDPHLELDRRLKDAPREHAEALLVAYDILQTAHDQGLLDTVHGLVGAKDTIFAKLSDYARLPEGIKGIRNLITGLKILSTLDPELLESLAKTMGSVTSDLQKEQQPPSLFQIMKRTASKDSRRALSFMTLLLTGFGRSLKG